MRPVTEAKALRHRSRSSPKWRTRHRMAGPAARQAAAPAPSAPAAPSVTVSPGSALANDLWPPQPRRHPDGVGGALLYSPIDEKDPRLTCRPRHTLRRIRRPENAERSLSKFPSLHTKNISYLCGAPTEEQQPCVLVFSARRVNTSGARNETQAATLSGYQRHASWYSACKRRTGPRHRLENRSI